jgi:hypothetical protein
MGVKESVEYRSKKLIEGLGEAIGSGFESASPAADLSLLR